MQDTNKTQVIQMYVGLYKVYTDDGLLSDGFIWMRANASASGDRKSVVEYMGKRYASGSFKIVKV
jgi:hypothetical protein